MDNPNKLKGVDFERLASECRCVALRGVMNEREISHRSKNPPKKNPPKFSFQSRQDFLPKKKTPKKLSKKREHTA